MAERARTSKPQSLSAQEKTALIRLAKRRQKSKTRPYEEFLAELRKKGELPLN